MKKYIGIILPVLFFILNSCGHEVQKASEDNFTPPALKVQPRLIYPKVAQENNYSGTSKLLLRITKEGTVDKVSIVKSSGYRVLDDAAMDYCKNLIFYPAQVNGRPIDSRIEWELKFQFTDQNWSVHNYITDIEYLYKRISQVKSNDRNNIQKEILIKHNQFVTNMNDGLNFNTVLEIVLLPEISTEWKEYWNSWPLSFLLYYDFIKRFPDYDSLDVVKEKLQTAIMQDIKFIKNSDTVDFKTQTAKEYILLKIKKFVSEQFPGMTIDNSSVVISKERKPIS